MGLGPIAGILAIAVADTGVLAKLFAEAVENIDRKQVEGIIQSALAAWWRLRFGVLPQVLPVMISQTLYRSSPTPARRRSWAWSVRAASGCGWRNGSRSMPGIRWPISSC